MPRNFARRTYEHWIGINRHRFRFPPRVLESRKQYFTLGFSGVAPELTLGIQSWGGANMYVHDAKGVHWDILTDFDVFAERTADGQYFCRLCELSINYPTRAALWEAHIFEPMLEWVNNLTADHRLWLYRQPGVTAARLIRVENEAHALKAVCADLEILSRLVPVKPLELVADKRLSISLDGRLCIVSGSFRLCSTKNAG